MVKYHFDVLRQRLVASENLVGAQWENLNTWSRKVEEIQCYENNRNYFQSEQIRILRARVDAQTLELQRSADETKVMFQQMNQRLQSMDDQKLVDDTIKQNQQELTQHLMARISELCEQLKEVKATHAEKIADLQLKSDQKIAELQLIIEGLQSTLAGLELYKRTTVSVFAVFFHCCR